MLDVMLIREFGVEEINAPGVAKAFVEGCRMVGLLNDNNIIADIDALSPQNGQKRELTNLAPKFNTFRDEQTARGVDLSDNRNVGDIGRNSGSVIAKAIEKDNFIENHETKKNESRYNAIIKKMVEVFKTNVLLQEDAMQIIDSLEKKNEEY